MLIGLEILMSTAIIKSFVHFFKSGGHGQSPYRLCISARESISVALAGVRLSGLGRRVLEVNSAFSC